MREKFNKNITWIKDNGNKCLMEKDGIDMGEIICSFGKPKG